MIKHINWEFTLHVGAGLTYLGKAVLHGDGSDVVISLLYLGNAGSHILEIWKNRHR